GRLLSRVNVVGDGVEAQAYLRRKGQYADAMQPDLILFDLNLPKKNGRELVPEINVGPTLRRIRLIVLTTLSAEDDILRTYDLHANCDLTKPVDPG
ncbi:MAG: response regulator, partial [Candidatus Latescibacteria bacterium]|nr:response regulator [Candidatus Latescibacterota bacterium]NIT03301.1 response regulator [Candidatus Latescibacterota bacterium]